MRPHENDSRSNKITCAKRIYPLVMTNIANGKSPCCIGKLTINHYVQQLCYSLPEGKHTRSGEHIQRPMACLGVGSWRIQRRFGWKIPIIFPHIFGIIIPIDELIFFRGVGFIPPASIISIINWLVFPGTITGKSHRNHGKIWLVSGVDVPFLVNPSRKGTPSDYCRWYSMMVDLDDWYPQF